MKASEIIALMESWAPGLYEKTCDTVKAGDPERDVSCVAMCCFATPNVIREVSTWGAQLLITHEPTVYDHWDNIEDTPVGNAKRALLGESDLVLYRYHDHLHAAPSDMIGMGEIETLGLKGVLEERGASEINRFSLTAPMTVRELARHIEKKMNILVCSFSSLYHVQNSTFILLPDGIHLDAYAQLFRNDMIPKAYMNTIIVTVCGTALSITLTILGAFCLSRKNLPGRTGMTLFVVFTMLFNGGLIPTYLVVRNLGMLNSLKSLIFPTAISTYNMIILRNFFSSVPDALQEAAIIDGANQRTYLLRILLPLSGAAIATITLFYAVDYWNAYFYSLIYINKRSLLPMQAILRQALMTSEFDTMMYDDGIMNLPSEMLKDAMIVVTALPIICIYPFVQRFFVKGVMVGSVKG